MMMRDDEVMVGWQIAPEIREAMRLERARMAMGQGAFPDVVMELEELLDENPEQSDGLFLLGEALIELGDFEGARQAYEHRIEIGAPFAELWAGLAVARFNTCDLHGAVSAAREAVRMSPELGEAHYTLGLALERLPGEQAGAVSAFAAAHQLDPQAFPFPLRLQTADWERAVQEALHQLPPSLQQFWAEVPVVLLEVPDLSELRQATPPITPTVTGLYQGAPPEEVDPWEVRPEALRLYTRNLLRCPSLDVVIETIAQTLEREGCDWLGVAPEELV